MARGEERLTPKPSDRARIEKAQYGMTARRLRSFRHGDLAEGLGCELLRRLAAVARVPREEDFGIDAICTLLRDDATFVLAENTFAVQVKAASPKPLTLTEGACNWLQRLDIPLFLLSVDLERAAAALYSYELAIERPADLEFNKGSRKIYTTIPRGRRVGPGELQALISDVNGQLDHRQRWLGEPVATMTLSDLATGSTVKRIRELLKSWCGLVLKRIYYRRFGINFGLLWKTDSPPKPGSLTIDTTPAEVPAFLHEMMPLLLKAETGLAALGGNRLAPEFLAIKKRADELGVWVPGFSQRPPGSPPEAD